MEKMSEVFDLPLAADGHGGLYDGYMERIGELNYNADAENIANALNCHDELVEAIELSIPHVAGSPLALRLNKLLKKARGEA